MVSICTFKQDYLDFQSKKTETFPCDVKCIEDKDRCLFHNENYLKGSNYPENKDKVIEKLQERIENSKKNKTPLKCIGYYLPDITLNKEEFTQQVYFNHCKFQKADFSMATFKETADFSRTTFSSEADFSRTTFSSEADFSKTIFNDAVNFTRAKFSNESYFSGKFKGTTSFNYSTFEKPNESRFEVEDMSMVSFLNTDITQIRFSDNIV